MHITSLNSTTSHSKNKSNYKTQSFGAHKPKVNTNAIKNEAEKYLQKTEEFVTQKEEKVPSIWKQFKEWLYDETPRYNDSEAEDSIDSMLRD